MDYRKFVLESVIAFLKEKSVPYLSKYEKYFFRVYKYILVAFPHFEKKATPAQMAAAKREFDAGTK